MRKKRKERPKWQIRKDEAWKVFSIWVRNRDPYCVTCKEEENKLVPSEQAGHFYHGVLDFDEENIHCQCIVCNKWKSGNLAVYSVKLLNELGEERFKALDQRHTMAMKGDKKDLKYYEDIIEKYSKLLIE